MIPAFAVVGHPNKGKSSIVATLSENAAIAISAVPGTTRNADHYTLTVNGESLYTLIDTPGFQRAGKVLQWLLAHEQDASTRADVVARFVAQHQDNPDFHDECELLRPVLDGAGILYVVDGTKPYGAEYELEMQILQWTGRPRMALINMIGEGDYTSQWRGALDQYFSIVRTFDAMHADFDERIGLLRAFGELDQSWRSALAQAITVLENERRRQLERAAGAISDLLCDCVGATFEMPVQAQDDAALERLKSQAQSKLLLQIRQREQRARNIVQAIYRHESAEREEPELKLVDEDLFTETTWALFGLSRTQLLATGGISGALAGGGLDLLVGGTSLLAGSVLGALVGSASAWLGSDELAKVKVLGTSLGGRMVRAGPIPSLNFPWVLLGRARLHHQLISERNHALRTQITVQAGEQGAVFADLDSELKRPLDRLFAQLRKGEVSSSIREELCRQITQLLQAADHSPI